MTTNHAATNRASMGKNDLRSITSLPGNHLCAEGCNRMRPKWASVTYGTLICLECSGLHRGLGTHISFVRSLDMDYWSKEEMNIMFRGGNAKFERYLDERLGDCEKKIEWRNLTVREKYMVDVVQEYRNVLRAEICADKEASNGHSNDTMSDNQKGVPNSTKRAIHLAAPDAATAAMTSSRRLPSPSPVPSRRLPSPVSSLSNKNNCSLSPIKNRLRQHRNGRISRPPDWRKQGKKKKRALLKIERCDHPLSTVSQYLPIQRYLPSPSPVPSRRLPSPVSSLSNKNDCSLSLIRNRLRQHRNGRISRPPDWRKQGKKKKRALPKIERCDHPPSTVSQYLPIQRYYEMTDKLTATFFVSLQNRDREEAYIYGHRFVRFVKDVLSIHPDYHCEVGELMIEKERVQRELRRVTVELQKIEEWIDEEEYAK
eukprot:CAMPEP_0194394804 /NCGR_PEP_ID=MMETSP0174-20130528/124059_1 /TAXON_ID=216777 /ORGANISM="Proboscia alata, Strain PI-D3" /LENGTH=426 /DNA_ID=CAMNT_0039190645 /DNA_START=122 /DNA_END=1402 /DNA_ORIENTATION=-